MLSAATTATTKQKDLIKLKKAKLQLEIKQLEVQQILVFNEI